MTSFFTFIQQHRTQCICFALFTLLALVGLSTHEMWYDEAQAWQIARTASLKDIVFLIPHWEGHPPFWHLLLAVPAKLGVPWQWGVGMIGLLFMLANGFLIIFKAPFPRWVGCLLPFSYFLFYQYGIIVRPYSALTLIMLLLAIYFPQKDTRSTLYIVLLAALCACHLFGIAIAGGITLAWLWELKAGRPWKEYIPALFKDSRFHKMLLLLGFVVVLFALMRQTDGILSSYLSRTQSVFKHGLYVLLGLPADAVLTNLGDPLQLMRHDFPWSSLLSTCVVGLMLWGLLWFGLPRKRWLYFLLPCLFVMAIMLHYCSRHHIGLILVLVVWYAWITLQQFPLATHVSDSFKRLAQAAVALILIVPLGWSLYAVYLDYKLVFFPGKGIVSFLEKYDLTHTTIFAAWDVQSADNRHFLADSHMLPMAVILNVYMPYNMIANLNNGSSQAYLINTFSSTQETSQLIDSWNSRGLPEVLLGPAALPMVYDDPDVIKQYRAAFVSTTYVPWKFNRPEQREYVIYLRQDVWDKLKRQIMADARN